MTRLPWDMFGEALGLTSVLGARESYVIPQYNIYMYKSVAAAAAICNRGITWSQLGPAISQYRLLLCMLGKLELF